MRLLFALFIIVPLLEMLLLIKVGGIIGALPTVALVCLTAAIGVALIRAQGIATMARAQQQMAAGQMPASAMLDAVCLLLGGAMLLTPGFVTDSLGFVLLIPSLRQLLFHRVLRKAFRGGVVFQQFGTSSFTQSGTARSHTRSEQSQADDQAIDGEFHREDDDSSKLK